MLNKNIISTKIIVSKRSKDIPKLSLCIPTNGIAKWIFPVLDSIYQQNIDEKLYEVVVMDNGTDDIFCTQMKKYAQKHINIVYAKTTAYEFMSEIEAYKQATGVLIKFINHRTKLNMGTLKYLLHFINKYSDTKPCIYFSNGVISKLKNKIYRYNNFDKYIENLSYWSSWSTGIAFWKSDFEKIDLSKTNKLFPHTVILFFRRNAELYIIDNNVLLEEISIKHNSKGRYNLFNAFAIEYPQLILQLYLDNNISKQTFLKIKRDTFQFITSLYLNFIIRKKPCSYDLSDYKNSINVFYDINKLRINLVKFCFNKFINKYLRL